MYMQLNITWNGHNGDLPDLVQQGAPDDELIRMAEEALRTGGVPGIPADPRASLSEGFVIQRFPAGPGREYPRAVLRVESAYG